MIEALKHPRNYLRTAAVVGSSTLALFAGSKTMHYEIHPAEAARAAAIATKFESASKLGLRIDSEKTKPNPDDISYELGGRDVSVGEVVRSANHLGRRFIVHDQPFPGLGGYKRPVPLGEKHINLGKLKEDVDQINVAEYKRAFSNHFVGSLKMENGLRVNVYSFEDKHDKLQMDPQGVTDMINYTIAITPYLPNSQYKTWAMQFLKKTQAKDLGNVQANFFISALQNSCIDKQGGAFRKLKSIDKAYQFCSAWGREFDAGRLRGERRFFNLPFAVARPDDAASERRSGLKLKDTQTIQTLMHEFGHGIISVAGQHSDTDAGYNAEHDQFVIPLSDYAVTMYTAAVQLGLARAPFKFVEEK